MPAEPARRSVVVGAEAGGLRRELGPVSWMVLEELMLRSTGSQGDCVACVSVRTVAGSLGLAKDTVARAIRRLRDTGFVAVVQRRTNAGVFDAATYRITVPAGILVCPDPTPVRAPFPTPAQASASQAPPHSGRVARRDDVQLTLAAWD